MSWAILEHTTASPITRDFGVRLVKLARFAGLVEDKLAAEAAALGEQIDSRAAGMSEDDRQDYYEYHVDDVYELGDELPSVLRFAVLTAADSAMEWYLGATCETYIGLRRPALSPKDLAGNGVLRSKAYLKKVAGVAFPDQRPAWGQVLRLHELRNSVVHADGVLTKNLPLLREWATTFPGVRISDAGVLALGTEFTDAALDAYAEFAADFDVACEPLALWHSVFPPIEVDDL